MLIINFLKRRLVTHNEKNTYYIYVSYYWICIVLGHLQLLL